MHKPVHPLGRSSQLALMMTLKAPRHWYCGACVVRARAEIEVLGVISDQVLKLYQALLLGVIINQDDCVNLLKNGRVLRK